jgi:hypothetical protein
MGFRDKLGGEGQRERRREMERGWNTQTLNFLDESFCLPNNFERKERKTENTFLLASFMPSVLSFKQIKIACEYPANGGLLFPIPDELQYVLQSLYFGLHLLSLKVPW